MSETAGAAHFAVSYGDGAHLLLHSDRRADAILLEALIADSPKSDLIPKLVEGLLAHRTAGRWTNTQENVFVLLALDRYFETYEKATPDFVARAWLGERYAGEHAFRGRTTERSHIAIPMPYLREGTGPDDLVLAQGRARAGSTTASACATRRQPRPRRRSTAASRSSALRGRRRPGRRPARRGRHLAHPGRGPRARAADDGRAGAALPRRARRSRCRRASSR